MYDLIVIGGGPAGTSAAITASREGAKVLLLERGIFPRHKVCGEFISAESLDLLASLLGPNNKASLENAIRISMSRVFLDGRTIETPVTPPAASVARLNLDAALWESARIQGVDSLQKTTVQGVSGIGPFRLVTSNGEFEGRAAINASGRWSNLTANLAQGSGSSGKWLGLKGHFLERTSHPSVDLYFFVGGYCGVQPVNIGDPGESDGRINVCAMVRADVATTLQEVFRQQPQLEERSSRWKQLSDPVSTSSLRFRSPTPLRDGIFMAGDAAVFVDPFVGDGISMALRSGALAAQTLMPFFRKKVSLQNAAQSYQKSYQQRLAPVFRASSMIRRMLELPRAVRLPMIFVFRNSPRLSRYLVAQTR